MKMTFPRFGLLLAVVLIACLWPSIIGGKTMVPADLLWACPPHTAPKGVDGVQNFLIGDMLYENFVWKTLLREAAADDEWPLWNPYSFCGHPLYATGQASTFYPLNAIFALVPLPRAYAVFTLIHLWLGGMFQYWFLRRLGVSGFGAAVGGLVFSLCGFFAMRLIWPMLLGSAIWMPLMLVCIQWMADSWNVRHAAKRVAISAVVFALPLLSGFFEIAFYAFMVAGLFTLALCWRLWRESVSCRRGLGLCGQALVAVMFAALLAMPQLLPFFEVTARNTRVDEADYDLMVGRALQAEHLLPMIIPDFFGNPARHEAWNLQDCRRTEIRSAGGWDCYSWGTKNYSENGYYLGLLPLALAVAGLGVRGHHRGFLLALLALSLAMAFGTKIYALFFYTVPGYEQVRTPFRWMFPATFVIACLAASGAGAWQARLSRARSNRNEAPADAPMVPSFADRLIAMVLLAGPVVLIVILAGLMIQPRAAYRLALEALSRFPRLGEVGGFEDGWALAGFMWENLARFALTSLAVMIVLALPHLRRWGRRGVQVASLAALAVVAVDAGTANYAFPSHTEPAWLDRVPPSLKLLQQDTDVFRVARFGHRVVLHPNLPALYGLQDVGGYDSIILGDYARYMGAIERLRSLWWNQNVSFVETDSLDSPLFALLNVRYMLAHPGQTLDHPDWELVFEDGMRVYRNRREHPRAFIVHRVEAVASLDEAIERIASGEIDPAVTAVIESPGQELPPLSDPPVDESGKVQITRYGLNRVDLTVASPASGILVLCDMMYPGWQAYVDGQQARTFKANGIFRGVFVEAGTHDVSFRFEPASLRRGGLLCGGTVFLLFTALIVSAWRGRHGDRIADEVPSGRVFEGASNETSAANSEHGRKRIHPA